MKKMLAWIFILALLLPSALALDATEISGYSKANGYDYVTFGSYPTDADGGVQPILWRVLRTSSGEAYMLSEYILFPAPVHLDYDHYDGWENSDLFAYLNNEFLNEAFDAAQQQALLVRTEDNGLVTLITADEMKDASIGFATNNDRLCESTAWAKAPRETVKKTLYIYSKGRKYSPWWSRTRSDDYKHEQRRVMDEGKLGRVSTGNQDLGVRPAITIDLKQLTIASGSGTKQDPYVLISTAPVIVVPTAEPVVDAPVVETPAPIVWTVEDEKTETVETDAPVVWTVEDKEPAAPAAPTPTPMIIVVPLVNLPLSDEAIAAPAPAVTPKPAATAEPVMIAAPQPSVTVEEQPEATEVPQVWEVEPEVIDVQQVWEVEPEEEVIPEDTITGYTAAADPAYIHEKFPELTEEGFLPEGEPEFIYKDEKNGLWLYASQTLRIQIERKTGKNSKNQPLRWYEAQVFTASPEEMFDLFPYDESRYTYRYALTDVDKIAKAHNVVFAINSDYFIYRVTRDYEESYDYPIGIEVRDGKVLYSRTRKASSSVYPPLDMMAFYPNGNVRVFQNTINSDSSNKNATYVWNGETISVTSTKSSGNAKALAEEQLTQKLLDSGATDVLSFGPILVENGEVASRSTEFGNTPNPRTAFGMVEPGYYICVMVESRVEESKGESCVWLGKLMADLGCEVAFNLDGGATSTMLFMGEQINKTGNYGDITNRQQNELLGIGYSELVK